jgi:carboxylesterase
MILHGFTANLESIRCLFQPIADLGLKIQAPLLRGHGLSSPEGLRGTGWSEWLADAESALRSFAGKSGRIIVVGHSMGALLALQLAVRYPELVDSLVLATPPFKLVSVLAPGRPMHFLAPVIRSFVSKWELQTTFVEPEMSIMPDNYSWAPTDAILSFFDLIEETEPLLGRVSVPVLILHNRKESIVLPESADLVYSRLATAREQKSIVWFERSDHQLFCDCERIAAVNAVTSFIAGRISAGREVPACQH